VNFHVETKYAVKKREVVFGGGEIPGKWERRRIRISLSGRRKTEKAAKQLLNSSAVENTSCIAFALSVSAFSAF